MKSKVIVFGATSFIGSYLLAKNKTWKGTISKKFKEYDDPLKKKRVDKQKKKLIFFNFLKKNTIDNVKKFNIFINCIGFTKNFEKKYFDISKEKKKFNLYVKILKNIIKKNNVKLLIHIGSNYEYGNLNKINNENSKCVPISKYGIYKLYEFNKLKKILPENCKLVNIRCFSIFGKYNKTNSLIEQIKTKESLMIKNPNQQINLIAICYLNNLIKKIINSYKKLNNTEIINFCSTKPFTIRSIFKIIKIKRKVFFGKIAHDNIIGSNNKMKEFINYNDKSNLTKLRSYLN
jgi:nucleoside-diphosphate-sugar epimerase